MTNFLLFLSIKKKLPMYVCSHWSLISRISCYAVKKKRCSLFTIFFTSLKKNCTKYLMIFLLQFLSKEKNFLIPLNARIFCHFLKEKNVLRRSSQCSRWFFCYYFYLKKNILSDPVEITNFSKKKVLRRSFQCSRWFDEFFATISI